MLGIRVKTTNSRISDKCVSSRASAIYVVEVIYEREPVLRRRHPALRAGVDIGLNNLATLASDKPGFVPRVVNGRPVKSINQFYNKRRAQLQCHLGEARTSRASGARHDQAHASH